MSDVRDIRRSSRIRPLELNAASEDSLDSGTLITSREKHDIIGKALELSFHYLRTSKLVLDNYTQVVVRYFVTLVLCELRLASWVDDWPLDELLFILAI